MPRYLDPKNDLIFKKVFGEHKNLCISLLNSLLPLDSPIESIEYDAAELVPDIPGLKDSVVDVRCVDKNSRRFIVEMQMRWSESFKSRVLFNASNVYVKQLEKKEDYELLQPVYSLNLVNKAFDATTDEFYHHYKIVNIANTEKQIKGLEFVFVELPKFKPKNVSEKKLMVLWLRYLTEMAFCDTPPPEFLADKDLNQAVECLKEASYTKAELDTYDRIQDAIRAHVTYFADARREGLAEGEAERQKLAKTIKEKDKAIEEKDKENERLKQELERFLKKSSK
jgi:predicted transposase/invertase (TIGR01784 family)